MNSNKSFSTQKNPCTNKQTQRSSTCPKSPPINNLLNSSNRENLIDPFHKKSESENPRKGNPRKPKNYRCFILSWLCRARWIVVESCDLRLLRVRPDLILLIAPLISLDFLIPRSQIPIHFFWFTRIAKRSLDGYFWKISVSLRMRKERERKWETGLEEKGRVAPLLHVLMESADATSDEAIISTAWRSQIFFWNLIFLLYGMAAGRWLLLMGPTGPPG